MKKKTKEPVIQKFGEMRYGQWFRERREKDPRVFVKIQNILPSGIQILHQSVVARDHYFPEGQPMAKKGDVKRGYYNAIDQDGIPGCCPDWVEFELIDSPFKQDYPNHNQGRNLNLPRYKGDKEQGDQEPDEPKSDYPKITINGVELSQGQAMTVHVALQAYATDMSEKNVLGDDEHGEFMRKAYLERIKEINKLYMGG